MALESRDGTSDVRSKVDAIRAKISELNKLLSSVRNIPDSCENQCVSGFVKFQRSCYQFVREEKTWQQAQNACRTMGANLVSIKSWEEQKFILNHIAPHKDLFPSSEVFHAGATDTAMEGVWQWVSDGSLVHGEIRLFNDSNDIQCASGFEKFQRSCYKFVREEKTWQQAQNDCRTMGANLVSIKSWEEQKFILDHIMAHKGERHYFNIICF
ncbi:asialoglycoprotein receptor 1-like [Lingula anatina]|uniref:Asialoglycoprotein receptor 1-like n=1 Tax=Lingula anatina TaxID=7574 RepID=A0A1S3J117_LINAN|nr:asialoglycoprotein receptor 1-like [Lingula anatina]|eukprot:XP_013404137.1 asialoglycoprotein receptor 1-like [Lingula anatina]